MQRINEALSDGFAELDKGRLDASEQAFGTALKLSPDNPVALGGLAQVADQRVLNRIAALERGAERAEASEDWAGAVSAYDEILTIDSNIRFAVDGRQRALAQRRASRTLGNIIANPDKLSSKQLFADAGQLLDEAKGLEPRGASLADQITAVEALLVSYGTPVPVTLRSDNLTHVTLSTVGKLGTFDEKRLELRPGAYTLIGSRDGCKDVRQNIVVRRDMQPVEIRCHAGF